MATKKTPNNKSPKPAAKKSAAKKNAPVKKKATPKKVVKKKVAAKKAAVIKTKPVKSAAKVAAKPAAKSKATAAPIAVKKVSRPARPKVFEQAPVIREFGFPADVPELPKNYGRDKLVLMTQDPDYLFSYWEITPHQLMSKESEKHKGEEYQEALKLNWPARSLFEENYALLPVSLDARRWYLRVPFPGLPYQVEIGWLGNRGHFISILGSNETESPEAWEATRKRLRDAGGVLSHTLRISKPSGSSERIQIEETILSLDKWNPGSLSSSAMPNQNGARKKKPNPAR